MESSQVSDLTKQAAKFISIGNPHAAVDLLSRYESEFKSNVTFLLQYAKALEGARKFQESLAMLTRAITIAPNEVAALRKRAGVLIQQDFNSGDAEKDYKAALKIKPDDVKTLSAYGKFLRDRERYEDALQCSKRLTILEPDRPPTLNAYAKDLALAGKIQDSIEILQKSLSIEPSSPQTIFCCLNCLEIFRNDEESREYILEFKEVLLGIPISQSPELIIRFAKFFNDCNEYEQASHYWNVALSSYPENSVVLGSYASFLLRNEELAEAEKFFLKSLQYDDTNILTLLRYSDLLLKTERLLESYQLLQNLNSLEPRSKYAQDIRSSVLKCSKQLSIHQESQKANTLLEYLLRCSPDDVYVMTLHANTLARLGNPPAASLVYKKALSIDPDCPHTLTYYARYLYEQQELSEAYRIIEKVRLIKPRYEFAVDTHAGFLVRSKQYDKAFNLYEEFLRETSSSVIRLNYFTHLVSYGSEQEFNLALGLVDDLYRDYGEAPRFLRAYGDLMLKKKYFEKACAIFRKLLEISEDSYISVALAEALEHLQLYKDAINSLMQIDLTKVPPDIATPVRIRLFRLYLRHGNLNAANKYYRAALESCEENSKDKTKLLAARSRLAINPRDEQALDLLKTISLQSPLYHEANEMLALNLDDEDYFYIEGSEANDGLNDPSVLNRAIYHKILNEIAVLNGISCRILKRSEDKASLISEITAEIQGLSDELHERRSREKQQSSTVNVSEYQELVTLIAQTAHDIADYANNQLAVIESKTRRAINSINPASSEAAHLKYLLNQLEITQSALNDLKGVNEGIAIRNTRFKVGTLFEKWQESHDFNDATIILDVNNSDSMISSDDEKIKSAINELVENSCKHNRGQLNLAIRIRSRDVINPEGIWGRTIPGSRRYLMIEISDNGNGVPDNKKNWIFQPLNTTSKAGMGGGLGLYIIRKTLSKMNGFIRETGRYGAKFEMYIPY